MTDKTDLIREIHEYVTAHGGENTATHLLVQAASAIQTQAAELEAVAQPARKQKAMTKPELIRLMRLLSGMESILLFSGMQHLNQRAHIPDYLSEELTALTEVLEREILK